MIPTDLIIYIIRPALKQAGWWSEQAEMLIAGTAHAESGSGDRIKQVNGPALGIYQCEPATHYDIHRNYLIYRPWYRHKVIRTLSRQDSKYINICPSHNVLAHNPVYSTLICRVHYLRVPEPLPRIEDARGMAEYWGEHYQTESEPVGMRRFELGYSWIMDAMARK